MNVPGFFSGHFLGLKSDGIFLRSIIYKPILSTRKVWGAKGTRVSRKGIYIYTYTYDIYIYIYICIYYRCICGIDWNFAWPL